VADLQKTFLFQYPFLPRDGRVVLRGAKENFPDFCQHLARGAYFLVVGYRLWMLVAYFQS
jgi:hypothetical protein